MPLTLAEIAERMGGEVKGDPSVEIHCVQGMDEAGPGAMTFLVNPKYIPKLKTTRASAVIVSPEFADVERNLLVVDNPYLVFARVAGLLMERSFELTPGIHASATIHPDAKLGSDVRVGPNVCVAANAQIGDRVSLHSGVCVGEECEVGADSVLFSNTVLYPKSVLGERCVIHANCTIGSAGFGYAPNGRHWEKIPQVCRAVLGDDVELGANSVVNRGAARDTIVGNGTKIDSFVIVSHGVQIGEDCLFVSQTGISGSVTIGNHCTFGGQVGIAGHISIPDDVTVGGQSGVRGGVESGKTYLGSPAVDISRCRRISMTMAHLPEMRTTMRDLTHRIDVLETQLAEGK